MVLFGNARESQGSRQYVLRWSADKASTGNCQQKSFHWLTLAWPKWQGSGELFWVIVLVKFESVSCYAVYLGKVLDAGNSQNTPSF